MKILLFLIIILFLLLIPISIKLRVIYENNKLNIYIYNILLKLPKPKNKDAKTEEKDIDTKAKETDFIRNIYNEYIKKNPYHGRMRRKLKPSIKLEYKITYGFEDAAITGLSYGIFSSILYETKNIIEKRLNVKRYIVNIEPNFNSPLLKFRIISIFSLNLVQIIYMLIIILKVVRKK